MSAPTDTRIAEAERELARASVATTKALSDLCSELQPNSAQALEALGASTLREIVDAIDLARESGYRHG